MQGTPHSTYEMNFIKMVSFRQKLAPVYEELADAFAGAKDKVVIAKVDADGEGRPLGQKYGVTGFPSAFLVAFSAMRLSANSLLVSTEVVQSRGR